MIWENGTNWETSRCEQCRETGSVRIVSQRLTRCDACGAIAPRAADQRPAAASFELPLPLGTGGVLRERYRVLERLGEGAHGATHAAEHLFLNHACVVKILPERVCADADAAQRLRNEARIGFLVNDPNVVRVLDCDQVEGFWYFVMEYVDGADLDAILVAELRVTWQQAARFALDASSGLAAVHRAGLVHGDIKPANLLLGCDGRLRISDLGVAAFAGDLRNPGRTGAPLGTVPYAAPEVFEAGSVVTAAADLYSLGSTLFQLITGRAPYAEKGPFAALLAPTSAALWWNNGDEAVEAPDWLRAGIERLLSAEPRDRFESAAAFHEYVRQWLHSPAGLAPAAPATEALRPRGIAVLAFQNEQPGADDWLGMALADALGRGLAAQSGVYLADRDQLTKLSAGQGVDGRALLEAARLVGAASVISGTFARQGDDLTVRLSLHSAAANGQSLGEVRGALFKLVELQGELLTRVSAALELAGPAASDAGGEQRTTSPAQEKFIRGKQAYLRCDYEPAIRFAEEALAADPDFIEASGFIGVCYARLGRYPEAQAAHQRQVEQAQARGDVRRLVEAFANLGVMHYLRGEYDEAHGYYRRAIDTAISDTMALELAQINNNLGFVLMRLGRADEAERAFLRAIETHRTHGALVSLIGPYNGIGTVLLEQKRYEEAEGYYRRALTLAQETGDRANVGAAHMHLGRCAALEGKFTQAKQEFTLALNALEETSFWNGLARLYEYMADMNAQLGNLAEAVRCCERRIELARQHSNERVEAAARAQLAEVRRLAEVRGGALFAASERKKAG